MAQNLTEKIVQKYSVGLAPNQKVHSGDTASIKPEYVMTHDNTGAVIPKFLSIGATRLANPRQVVHTLDHNIQDTSEKNKEKYRAIEKFSQSLGADFYPAGRGIGHQIMCEEGYVWPGSLVVASDSHSNMYGGLGALGTPIVRTDAASIWATGKTWWEIPPVAKVELPGKLTKGVTGKDVILALCGYFNHDEVLNHVIEFDGTGVRTLNMDQRLTIANMTTEWGALGGIFPVDEITINWLEERAAYIKNRGLAGVPSDADGHGEHPRLNRRRIAELKRSAASLKPDDGAFYAKNLTIDLGTIEPSVSGPDTVKITSPVSAMEKPAVKVDKAYLVSCVNSRLDDIREAAGILRGRKISPGVRFYVAAASSEVQKESEKRGDWQVLLDAGAIPLPPGCGPCIGLGTGLLEDGEVGISATNRNFKGRMGSPGASTYLASPAVVAYSALTGRISFPWKGKSSKISGQIIVNEAREAEPEPVAIMEGFPEKMEGDLLYCPQNNINTDGIFPGKYTYNDDFKPEDMAKVAMENYDPEFQKIVKEGDMLAAGFNFGTGSSREQAATALKYRGIRLVIAGSASQTYKRNALNNGFLVLEVPRLINDLKEQFDTTKLTIPTNYRAVIDFKNSRIELGCRKYFFSPVGTAAQELVVAGGLESWIARNL
jgi:homoaconitate hydratase